MFFGGAASPFSTFFGYCNRCARTSLPPSCRHTRPQRPRSFKASSKLQNAPASKQTEQTIKQLPCRSSATAVKCTPLFRVRPCWGQDAGDIHHHLSTLTCSHLCPGLLCPPQTVRLGLLLRCPHAPSMLRHRCHRPPPRVAVPPPQRSSSDTEAAGEVAVHRVHCGGNAARRRMLWGLAGVRNAVAAAATPVHSSELNCPQLRAQPQRSSIPSTAQQNAAGCPLPPPLHQSFISLTLSQETVDYSDPRRSVRLQRCASRLLCHVMRSQEPPMRDAADLRFYSKSTLKQHAKQFQGATSRAHTIRAIFIRRHRQF